MQTLAVIEPNQQQKEAINSLDGPIMLLAGPGTGKTFTLIKRIENMIQKGINPQNILCLTFSDAASNEMKSRLLNLSGVKGASVNVFTYHSFCMDAIRSNPSLFELKENVMMADDITKQAILKESIDEFDKENKIEFLKDKWGNKYFYINAILSSINTIKRERTTKEEYFKFMEENEEWNLKLENLYLEKKEREEKNKVTKDILKRIETQEKKIGKAKEFYSIYEIYQKKLSLNALIDYADMINLVVERMEEDFDFLYSISKDYKYVLVDEYQDTSKVQNEIIFNILKGASTRNIFVVGDDDQIIYSFQGAQSRNLSDFLEKFKDTKIICLEENRRSSQTILDFATCLIKDDPCRLTNNPNFNIQKKLIAKGERAISNEKKIDFNIYSETIQENNEIIQKIQNLISKGTKMSEIAIILRKNDQLENYARLLKQNNIPYAIQKQKNAFDVPSFIQIYFYLKILANSYIEQDKLFALISYKPFYVSDYTLSSFLKLARKYNNPWFNIIEDNIEGDLKELKDFYSTYISLKNKKSYMPLVPFIHEVITKTGILEYYANNGDEERFENISSIKRLIDEARAYSFIHKSSRIDDFIKHLDSCYNQGIKMELDKPVEHSDAIQLATYHGSKGREFEHVFLPDLTSRVFEKFGANNKEVELPIEKSLFSQDKDKNKDAELRRLLFVGITRAKFGLYISYAQKNENSEQSLSKYICDLFPELDYLVNKKIFDLTKEIKADEIVKDIVVQYGTLYKNELINRTKNITLSQTSLNAYLNCPLNYFYSDILSVPVFVEDKDILAYGSSIHYAIDIMTKDAIKNGRWNTSEYMTDNFLEKINTFEFSSPDKKLELIERGKNSIEKNYYKFIESNPSNIISTEYRMEADFEGIKLKGFADRISKDNEGNILITDFKTGSYKKADSNPNYYNQLRFYKFLYELINGENKVKKTSLTFFEEGCKQTAPEIEAWDNEEIKQKIKEAIKGIKELNFEPKQDEKNCGFCAYKLICKLYTSEKH